jgi:hypothetical protein
MMTIAKIAKKNKKQSIKDENPEMTVMKLGQLKALVRTCLMMMKKTKIKIHKENSLI